MSAVPTNNWTPSCQITALHQRAQLLADIREFFRCQRVLEVETPLLGNAVGTDPALDFFTSHYRHHAKCSHAEGQAMYLQTSPEFAMKRLLAGGSGSIFQICKAFRNGEVGRLHNPEFSILEWYRLGYNTEQLMDDTTALLQSTAAVADTTSPAKYRYSDLFSSVTSLNPVDFCPASYQDYAANNAMTDAAKVCGNDHASWLDYIFSHKIQPTLARQPLCMVYDYPAVFPSLALAKPDNPALQQRFEVFINGLEIGNGYSELADTHEQERRFDQQNEYRKNNGLPLATKDGNFLAALAAGLPPCSGIAVGIDRLQMVLAGADSIDEVLAFAHQRA